MQLILASTSKYRKELLSRLGLPFESMSPSFDEESFKSKGLSPLDLAQTLARKKAESLAGPDRCVIGGDQLVSFEGQVLGKPHTFAKACETLELMSGKTHELVTAVHIVTPTGAWDILDRTFLTLRNLNQQQIEAYVRADQPLDCAGSYKIEGRGISLFAKIESKDFTAIQGLPLIEVTSLLHKIGFSI